jgi:uncharacterized protein YjbI with pentapeptide repeats
MVTALYMAQPYTFFFGVYNMTTISNAVKNSLVETGSNFAGSRIKISNAFVSIKKLDKELQPSAVQLLFDGVTSHYDGMIEKVKTTGGKKAAVLIGELLTQQTESHKALWTALRQYTSKHVMDGQTIQRKKGVLSWDAAQVKTTKADASKADATKADATKADASKADATKADASKADATKADASKADASKADASTGKPTVKSIHALAVESLTAKQLSDLIAKLTVSLADATRKPNDAQRDAESIAA